MIIDIHAPHISLTPSLKKRIQKKIAFSFKRFDQHINTIILSLDDINGPRGGRDKSCCLTLRLDKLNDIVITGTYEGIYQCIERTCERAKKSLVNRIDKNHSQHKKAELLHHQHSFHVDAPLF